MTGNGHNSGPAKASEILGVVDEEGFFGVRLESIGGLGAHLAGQMLAEAAVLRQGLNAAHFSSYGSEKKGSPVKSYVRFCAPEHELRTSSPIDRPHVVGIFHEALIGDPSVTSGLAATSTVIVNSTVSPEEMRRRLGITSGRVGVVDAMGIAVEEGSRVNTAMLGAVVSACKFIDPEAVRQTIKATFDRRYPHLVQANIRTFDRAFKEVKVKAFRGDAPTEAEALAEKSGAAYGYLEAPVGGTILNPGNSILKDLTASRQGFIPVFDRDACVDCGLCDLVCPDFCLTWEEEESEGRTFIRLRGIDYRYCKGCLKCIDACPTLALTEAREEEGYAAAHTVPLYPWLAGPKTPVPAGAPRR